MLLPPLDWNAQFSSLDATRTSQQNANSRMGAAGKKTHCQSEWMRRW
jgi:hypothetical protein